ncbi:MAG TPA: S8 family serine peptidase, partial [Pyrinomonadaceae bacterium]|nr:S8 family serine peptidase [Pyrinomonadaceae bacterium]
MIINRKSNKFNPATKTAAFVLLLALMLTNVVSLNVYAQTSTQQKTTGLLAKYTTDLTALAKNNEIRPSASFDREVDRLATALSEGGQQQPVILDAVGKDELLVVEALAGRIADGRAGEGLKGTRVLKLDVDTLFDQKKDANEVIRTLDGIFIELRAENRNTILFVDELANFVGNSRVSDSLTAALVNGTVRIIGGSSLEAYKENVESNDVAAMFKPIVIGGDARNLENPPKNNNGIVASRFKGDNVSPDLREMMANDPTGGNRKVEVIVQAKNDRLNGVANAERIGGSNTFVTTISLNDINALSTSGGVNYVSPNRDTLNLGHVEVTTGATLVRSQGSAGTLDGTGIGIAVLDSGIYSSHNTFKSSGGGTRVVYSKNFVSGESTTADSNGHGTHVAGLAAGSSNSNGGAYKGIASNANLINLRVLNGQGMGKQADLLAALEWVRVNWQAYNIRVINISLGTPAIDSYLNDPVTNKIWELSQIGIVTVAAAGNDGQNAAGQKIYGMVHSPGNESTAITVGASNSMGTDSRGDDNMTTYSSHGPTRSYLNLWGTKVYDHLIKPDLVAPGNKVVSAASTPNALLAAAPTLQTSALNPSGTANDMMYLSGSSMSTPLVAGTAALLLQANPKLTPSMIKLILQYSAQPLNGVNMFEQGAGQLNIEGAVRIANAMRSDVNFTYRFHVGSTLISTLPTPSSSISGTNFTWAQGIVTDHFTAKGTALISKYQRMYDPGWSFDDGIFNIYPSSVTPYTPWLTSDVIGGTNIMKSTGGTLGTGTVFTSSGVLMGDGVL